MIMMIKIVYMEGSEVKSWWWQDNNVYAYALMIIVSSW